MSTDFSKPLVTDAYATLLPGIQAAIYDLVRGLDPTLTGTSTNIPTGAKRLNESTGWWERFNGTSWVIYSMTGTFGSVTASDRVTGTALTSNGAQSYKSIARVTTEDAQFAYYASNGSTLHSFWNSTLPSLDWYDNTGTKRAALSSTGLAIVGALSAASDLTLSGTDGKVLAGTSAGRAIWGNSNTTTYAVAYGASHATNPNQFIIVTNGNVTTQDAAGNMVIGGVTSSWSSSWKALDFSSGGGSKYATVGQKTTGTSEAFFGWNAYGVSNISGIGLGYAYKTTGDIASMYSQNGFHTWMSAPSGTAGASITFTQVLQVGKGVTLALEGATSVTGTGVSFPATANLSTDPNTLDDYAEGSYTGAVVGDATGTITCTMRFVKIGKKVTLEVPCVLMTSNSGTLSISGAPSSIRPNQNRSFLIAVTDNGTTLTGYCYFSTTGVLNIYKDGAGNAFTSSGSKGVGTSGLPNSQQLTYFVS